VRRLPLTLTFAGLGLLPTIASASPPPEPEPAPRIDAGFSLDKGAYVSTERASFGIGLLAMLRYGATFNADGVDSLGFTLPFIRPNIHGSAFANKLRFFVQPELSGTPRLLDAQVIYQPIPAFGVDLGQYRPHVSRAWNTPIPLLALPGRGLVDDDFHTDRAAGATVFGQPLGGKLEYDVGLLNAGGFNLASPPKLQPLITWRIGYNPLGALPLGQTPAFASVDHTLIGIAAHGWSDPFTTTPSDPQTKPSERQRVVVGGDVTVMTPRVHVLVEGFGRWQVNKTGLRDVGWGSQAQVGVMLLPKSLELQARAGVLDQGINKPLTGVWEGGLSWYLLGNHLRAQLHYSCTQNLADPVGCTQHRGQLQTQLWF
jgi:hypothetical protein